MDPSRKSQVSAQHTHRRVLKESTSDHAIKHIAIGYAVKPKGIHGEVVIEPLTDDLNRFNDLMDVSLDREGNAPRKLRITSWRPDKPGILVKFEGIDNPEDAAAKIAKGYLTIPQEEVPDLPEGTFYVFQLIGCRVENKSGILIGEVVDVQELPSADMIVVSIDGREILIPLVGEFILDISIEKKSVVVADVEELVNIGLLNK